MKANQAVECCLLVVVLSFCFLAIRQNTQISSDLFAAFVSSIVTYSLTRRITKDYRVFEKIPLIDQEKE